MNSVTIIGRVGSIEQVITQNGTVVCSLSIATNDGTKEKPITNWHKCKAFSKTAELISQYVKKGDRFGVVGKIQYGSYDNKEGAKVYTTDIIVNQVEFLQDKDGSNQSAPIDVAPSNDIQIADNQEDSSDLPF